MKEKDEVNNRNIVYKIWRQISIVLTMIFHPNPNFLNARLDKIIEELDSTQAKLETSLAKAEALQAELAEEEHTSPFPEEWYQHFKTLIPRCRESINNCKREKEECLKLKTTINDLVSSK